MKEKSKENYSAYFMLSNEYNEYKNVIAKDDKY